MTWIKDQYETYVNIDNFDILDYTTFSHTKTNETVLMKFYLKKFNSDEEYIFGYKQLSSLMSGELYMNALVKGVDINVTDFDDCVRNYFSDKQQQYLSIDEIKDKLIYIKEDE